MHFMPLESRELQLVRSQRAEEILNGSLVLSSSDIIKGHLEKCWDRSCLLRMAMLKPHISILTRPSLSVSLNQKLQPIM